jgi:diaminopimelate epimerase
MSTSASIIPVDSYVFPSLTFDKYEGCGNDFIMLDLNKLAPAHAHLFNIPISKEDKTYEAKVKSVEKLSQLLCDRHFGIGADQIIIAKLHKNSSNSKDYDCDMFILNMDGSVAEMCGNGIRALGLYLYNNYSSELQARANYLINTLAGPQHIQIIQNSNTKNNILIRVQMSVPQLINMSGEDRIEFEGHNYSYYNISMGNPHAVIFYDAQSCATSFKQFPLHLLGLLMEADSERFPNRTNVELVEIINENEINVRIFERGSGLTLACGTGVCAAVVASISLGKVSGNNPVCAFIPGGKLFIEWPRENSPVIMTGPANFVYSGQFQMKNLQY